MSGRAALGARLPGSDPAGQRKQAPVDRASNDVPHSFSKTVEGLVILMSVGRLKAFFADLVDALSKVQAEESDDDLYKRRLSRAISSHEARIVNKPEPDFNDVKATLEDVLSAALSTRKGPPAPEPPQPKARAFDPQLLGNVYGRRRRAEK